MLEETSAFNELWGNKLHEEGFILGMTISRIECFKRGIREIDLVIISHAWAYDGYRKTILIPADQQSASFITE